LVKDSYNDAEEIENLFQIVERDLKDARSGVSADWRFGIAYNAALKLCTILLYAEGYRSEKNLQHYRTIQALPKILGSEKNDDADYLDTCRAKRNTAKYRIHGCYASKAHLSLGVARPLPRTNNF